MFSERYRSNRGQAESLQETTSDLRAAINRFLQMKMPCGNTEADKKC
jgi:hypothetical protein